MSRGSRSTGLLILMGLLVLGGFGCKKQPVPTFHPDLYKTVSSSASANAAPQNTNELPANFGHIPIPPEKADRYVPAEIVYLRQVLKNFANADSFRANMTFPSSDGITTGEIEYAKGKGLHGVLHIPGNNQTEVYLIGQDVFFRSNTSSWLNLVGTTEGTRTSLLFLSAFSIGSNASSTYISDSARIIDVKEQPSGCKMYNFTQYTVSATKETLHICVKDNLPTFVSVDTKNGGIDTSYRDYNTAIDIVSPVKKGF